MKSKRLLQLLLDWYADEMAEPQAAAVIAAQPDPGADDMTSPLKRLGLTTPKRLRRSARNDPDAVSPSLHSSAGEHRSPTSTMCPKCRSHQIVDLMLLVTQMRYLPGYACK